MKTAISLPDALFHEADRLAKRLRVPRSRLYATAIATYIEFHRNAAVTEALNEVYGNDPEQSRLDPVLHTLQEHALGREEW